MITDEKLLKIILNKLLHFFINDANINMNKEDLLTKVDKYEFNQYTSSIQISGKINRCVILSFSKNLMQKLQKEFIPNGYSKEETTEMVDNLPAEIANNVIGLALQSFPNGGLGVNISPPIALSNKDIDNLSSLKLNNAIRVQTLSGDIMCYVKIDSKGQEC